MPPIDEDGIHLEPPQWADLRLEYKNGKSRTIWIIEVKAGAELRLKQNPTSPQFVKKGGYGRMFCEEESDENTRRRYIVLGCNPKIGLKPGKIVIECAPKNGLKPRRKPMAITVQERSWESLQKSFIPTGIVNDLFATLGDFKINPFYMEAIKELSVRDGINHVADAWKVLNSVCDHLEISRRYRSGFDPESFEDGSGWIGIHINSTTSKGHASKNHIKLQNAVGGSNGKVAWIGYFFEPGGKAYAGVSLCCDSEVTMRKLAVKLEMSYPKVEQHPGKDEHWVDVKLNKKSTRTDFEWIVSVLKNVIQ